jgi:hypothetical protein
MTNDERDELIVEMHTDIKWVKESLTSHLKSHLTWAICIMGAVASVAGGCLVYKFTH